VVAYPRRQPAAVDHGLRVAKRPCQALSSTYDPGLADDAVSLPRLLFDIHFWTFLTVLCRFLLQVLKESWFGGGNRNHAEMLAAKAVRIRQLLTDLGPTFVKVGQFLSMRRDLLPNEVVTELSKLQDAVPAFALAIVRQSIAADLGGQPEQLFSHFETEPIAAASIGQVHRARLLDGASVVVKVQRPDLARRFYRDLGYMRAIAKIAGMTGAGERAPAWMDLVDEFGRVLFAEIDYIQEGRNADRLRQSLRHRPRIKVPRVIWQYTGRKVLTLEYLPATKIDNLPELKRRRIDLRDLGNLLVECYLEQVLLCGFFHADPHAGNLAVDEQGRLIIYDFGVMGEISSQQKEAFAGCLRALVAGDANKAAVHLEELGIVRQAAGNEPLVRTLTDLLACYHGKEILDLDFARLEQDVDSLIAGRALQLPPSLACVVRAGSSVDGLARTLKPGFNFAQAARRVVGRLAGGSHYRFWMAQGAALAGAEAPARRPASAEIRGYQHPPINIVNDKRAGSRPG